jgi:hypothetical protein
MLVAYRSFSSEALWHFLFVKHFDTPRAFSACLKAQPLYSDTSIEPT